MKKFLAISLMAFALSCMGAACYCESPPGNTAGENKTEVVKCYKATNLEYVKQFEVTTVPVFVYEQNSPKLFAVKMVASNKALPAQTFGANQRFLKLDKLLSGEGKAFFYYTAICNKKTNHFKPVATGRNPRDGIRC